jgi:hypothetical protein
MLRSNILGALILWAIPANEEEVVHVDRVVFRTVTTHQPSDGWSKFTTVNRHVEFWSLKGTKDRGHPRFGQRWYSLEKKINVNEFPTWEEKGNKGVITVPSWKNDNYLDEDDPHWRKIPKRIIARQIIISDEVRYRLPPQ